MKIITWNCNMAFRKKAEYILKESPDLLIVQECENLEKLKYPSHVKKPVQQLWYGKNPNKGVGIFSYSDFKISISSEHNEDFKYVIPIVAKKGDIKLEILAIWAKKPKTHDCYTVQTWKAVHHYESNLKAENFVLLGDLNSSSIWDKPNREYNHTNLVNYLKNKSIYSLYHTLKNVEQGKETEPTLFMHKKKERPYHIDFCFVSENLISRTENMQIGKFEDWIEYSDHMPIMISMK